jgi:serine/threonine protein phosphatase PrpC
MVSTARCHNIPTKKRVLRWRNLTCNIAGDISGSTAATRALPASPSLRRQSHSTLPTSRISPNQHRFSHVSMQGFRENMEDSHIIRVSSKESPLKHAIFAVFDGHGGSEVADEVASVASNIIESIPELQLLESSEQPPKSIGQMTTLIQTSIDLGFRHTDAHLKAIELASGSTANLVMLTPSIITCANAGDSRSVLSRAGVVVDLSFDHKPTHPGEMERIKKAGGSVMRGRVGGIIGVSRGFGDFLFKDNDDLDAWEQQITAKPDFISLERDNGADEFIILGCDGIWDVISNDSALKFVRTRLQSGQFTVEEISKALVHYCLTEGSKDNMTLIVVLFEAGEKLIPKRGGVLSRLVSCFAAK